MRALATLLTALTLLLVQSALLQLLPSWLPPPALGTLVILHLGLSPRWSLVGQVLAAFCIGYLFDLVSGAPRGTHALVYVLLVLFFGRVAARISVNGFLLRAGVSFAAALAAALLIVTTRALASSTGGFAGLGRAPLEAAFTALLGPAILGLLDRVEGRLPGARARGGLGRRGGKALGGGLPLG